MGGSGSGGYLPTPPASPCARLTFNAAVNSPQADVLTKLQEGSKLNVVLGTPGTVVMVQYQNAIAGSLTGAHVARLIDCMNSGFAFVAVVVSLNGGLCIVRVEAA